jgi:16S rRNA (uracil1498-N3)-methyltransferase
MPDYRVHFATPPPEAVTAVLTPEESHHLVVVNRATEGVALTAFDGAGQEWAATLLSADKRAARLRLGPARRAPAPAVRLTLAQALPKGGVMEDLVRHATEIGVACIQPLVTTRTQVELAGERADRKADKWRGTALEACKQCGNPWLPVIPAVRPLAEWLAATPSAEAAARAGELRLIACLQAAARPLRVALTATEIAWGSPPSAITVAIGPEGDFSPEEIAAAMAAGYQPVGLGPLVLRCETAAIYALAVLSARYF